MPRAPHHHLTIECMPRIVAAFLWETGDASEPPGKPQRNQNRDLTLLPAIGTLATAAVTPGAKKRWFLNTYYSD